MDIIMFWNAIMHWPSVWIDTIIIIVIKWGASTVDREIV